MRTKSANGYKALFKLLYNKYKALAISIITAFLCIDEYFLFNKGHGIVAKLIKQSSPTVLVFKEFPWEHNGLVAYI